MSVEAINETVTIEDIYNSYKNLISSRIIFSKNFIMSLNALQAKKKFRIIDLQYSPSEEDGISGKFHISLLNNRFETTKISSTIKIVGNDVMQVSYSQVKTKLSKLLKIGRAHV